MTEPLAYWNGDFLPQSQVHLGINDAGFVWGATVTDLCRTFKHELFRLEDHLERFRLSCGLARIPQPLNDDELAHIARTLVESNAKLITPEQDLALVMFATPGEIGYYLGQPGGPGDRPPTLCMHTFPLPFDRYARLIREGARLIVPHPSGGWSQPVLAVVKHRSRLHWWIAEQEVHDVDPQASALALSGSNSLTETAAANFLVVRDAKVFSPLRATVLRGTSLNVVEELCEELGIPLEFVDLKMNDWVFGHAHEAMLTSTPYCIVPVSRINNHEIPFPGPVCKALIDAWNRKVGLDIWGQICGAGRRIED